MNRPFLTFVATALSMLIAAGPAAAANFGFVRWPDYLDIYIVIAAVPTLLGAAWLKMVLPKGVTYYNLPKAERTLGLKLVGLVTQISLVALMAMIFVGMGLQRAAE
jgi:hypothetical protein